MQNPQGLRCDQSGHDASRHAQPAHPRAIQNPHQAKTPQSRHQSAIPNSLARALTIHDLALGSRAYALDRGGGQFLVGSLLPLVIRSNASTLAAGDYALARRSRIMKLSNEYSATCHHRYSSDRKAMYDSATFLNLGLSAAS